jgi:serine/threonine-protein kinase
VPQSQGAPSSLVPAQAAPASRTANLIAAVLGILLGLGGIAFFLFWHKDPAEAPSTPTVASTPPAPASAPPASVSKPVSRPPASAASVSASVSASATASATAPPAPAAHAPGDLAACVQSMFPPESFPASPDFAFLCTETDPLKGAAGVRAEMVRAHKNESVAMAEWALLGWYDLAAFSVMRGHCCTSPPPLKTAEVPKSCDAVPEVLSSIDKAVAQAKSPSDEGVQKAVDAYTHDIYCIVRTGLAARFGRVDKPQGGEDSAFKRFLARVIQAKR